MPGTHFCRVKKCPARQFLPRKKMPGTGAGQKSLGEDA
jgi:hypothetical protein